MGTVLACQAGAGAMREAGQGGSIVIFASISGWVVNQVRALRCVALRCVLSHITVPYTCLVNSNPMTPTGRQYLGVQHLQVRAPPAHAQPGRRVGIQSRPLPASDPRQLDQPGVRGDHGDGTHARGVARSAGAVAEREYAGEAGGGT